MIWFLHLAGKNMPDWINSNQKLNIYNHKEVKDSLKFISEYDIMLVPVFLNDPSVGYRPFLIFQIVLKLAPSFENFFHMP